MKFKAEKLSDKGIYRKNNQDYTDFAKNSHGDFFGIVCDGMGGHSFGEIASKISVDTFIEYFKESNFSGNTEEENFAWLSNGVKLIIKKMKAFAEAHPETLDMGTTLTCILFTNEKGYVLNIGDSRTYKFSNDKIRQITVDQNLYNNTDPEKRDEINNTKSYGTRFNEMTYWKVLTSALGPSKTIKIDKTLLNNIKGTYFLTTDGIHDYIDHDTIKDFLSDKGSMKSKCANIISFAKGNMSTDNLTILMIEVQ
ncbi:PP2C family protein-serine/threonine phosphatase [Mesoplasma photuris]|uniref:PP2C family protein-serine/threonine phosphatase n=1 Tax=Mesoplasma photuris TaxID=217731 RepID=UPI0004E1C127|nr:protein phosphatase 2C domain-containing protein [Mesoplasma photuris]